MKNSQLIKPRAKFNWFAHQGHLCSGRGGMVLLVAAGL